MKNNSIGKISVATALREATLKNKSSDLHTTMDFGSVMCGKLQRCIPGTEISVGTKERVLLTSLVRPTFGRMSLKAYHRFVPFSELTRNFGVMMGDESVYRGMNSFVPQSVPNVPLWELSLAVLFGAQMSIYGYGASYLTLRQIPASTPFDAPVSSLPSDAQTALNLLDIQFNYSSFGLTNAASIPLAQLLTGDSSYTVRIPLSNPTPASFCDYSTSHPTDLVGLGKNFVSVDGADYLIPVVIRDSSAVDHYYLLAFRLSSFGRRLRKNLIGCGWEFNIEDKTLCGSLYPFLAYYKAYFDTFGLTLYSNWEQSSAYHLLSYSDLQQNPSFNIWKDLSSSSADYLVREFLFGQDGIGNTFYTDEQDYVSAHTRSTAVAPSPEGLRLSIATDVSSTNYYRPQLNTLDVSPVEPSDLTTPNGHVYINNVYHGHLDSKLLMRLYQQTNAQTIAGRRIAELLRVQGLGKYVDECQSRFIGSWSLDLNVYDLPSQSDTYQNVQNGMRLGEMGAFGKSSGQHPMTSYYTDEDGYFITLFVVVPKGGYAESFDPDLLCLTKWQQYQPKYDSLGYEFTRKLETIQGSQPWSNMALNDGSLSASFGLSPRDFKRKFGRNVVNGDMSLRSTRHTYQPFNLERLIPVGEHYVGAVDTSQSGITRYPWESVNYLNPARTPIAGVVWRFPTRYEWISAFNRIFYNDSASVDQYNDYGVAYDDAASYEYFSLRDDNFIVHVVFDMQVWDQMLPVRDSFETDDEEKRSDTSISKA